MVHRPVGRSGRGAARGCGRGRCRGGRSGGRRRASRLRAADRRQGEQDDQRPGTQADSKTASSMLHIASIPPIEGALPLVSGWSQFNRGSRGACRALIADGCLDCRVRPACVGCRCARGSCPRGSRSPLSAVSGVIAPATADISPRRCLAGDALCHALPAGPVTVMVTSSEPGWTVSSKPELLPMPVPPPPCGTVAPPRFR